MKKIPQKQRKLRENSKTLELGKASKVKMEILSNKTQKINTKTSVTGELQRN